MPARSIGHTSPGGLRLSLVCWLLIAALQVGPATAQSNDRPAGAPPAAALQEPSAPSAGAPSEGPVPAAGSQTIETDGTGGASAGIALPHDLSPWSMFMAADILVKGVMSGLAFASLLTWTVFFGKTVEFGLARRRLRRGLARLQGAKTFAEARLALGQGDAVIGTFLGAVTGEFDRSERPVRGEGVRERVASRLVELTRAENQAMRRGMPLLATIGSVSPFVGLFGTVWGIMNAFIGISKAQTTNLAVVAPGIAEALLATAIGLVAAIPAVVVYNHFSQAGRRHQALVAEASGSVQRLLSRELDGRSAATVAEAAE